MGGRAPRHGIRRGDRGNDRLDQSDRSRRAHGHSAYRCLHLAQRGRLPRRPLDVPVPVIIDASVGFNPPNSGEKTGIGEVGRVVRAGSSRDGAIPSVSKVDRIPRHCYHIVAARLHSSTKFPRVRRRGLTNFSKRGRLPLPRARPHQLGESHCGAGGPGDGLIAFGATMYRCALPS